MGGLFSSEAGRARCLCEREIGKTSVALRGIEKESFRGFGLLWS